MFTLAFLLLLYFLPSIIAHNKRDATAILLLNFFLGWTGIGWLMALIWACASEPCQQIRMIPVAINGPLLLPVRQLRPPRHPLLHRLRPHRLNQL